MVVCQYLACCVIGILQLPAAVTEEPVYIRVFDSWLLFEDFRKVGISGHKCSSEFHSFLRIIEDSFIYGAEFSESIDRIGTGAELEGFNASGNSAREADDAVCNDCI